MKRSQGFKNKELLYKRRIGPNYDMRKDQLQNGFAYAFMFFLPLETTTFQLLNAPKRNKPESELPELAPLEMRLKDLRERVWDKIK